MARQYKGNHPGNATWSRFKFCWGCKNTVEGGVKFCDKCRIVHCRDCGCGHRGVN